MYSGSLWQICYVLWAIAANLVMCCVPIAQDLVKTYEPYTVKKVSRNSDVDNGGTNQTTWGSENSYSHVLWFCATVVNIGIWRIPAWGFFAVYTRVRSVAQYQEMQPLFSVSPERNVLV